MIFSVKSRKNSPPAVDGNFEFVLGRMAKFFQSFSILSSTYIVVAMAIDRCIAILTPLKAGKIRVSLRYIGTRESRWIYLFVLGFVSLWWCMGTGCTPFHTEYLHLSFTHRWALTSLHSHLQSAIDFDRTSNLFDVYHTGGLLHPVSGSRSLLHIDFHQATMP